MIALREFQEKDIKKLISWVKNEKFLLTWAGPQYKYPLKKEQIVKEMDESRLEKNKMLFSVINTETNNMIGHIQLLEIDRAKESATIGRVLIGDESMRNKGLGVKIIKTLLDKSFKELKLKEVWLVVFDYNKSAIACYKKAGFKEKKILKDAREYKGEKLSLVLMNKVL